LTLVNWIAKQLQEEYQLTGVEGQQRTINPEVVGRH